MNKYESIIIINPSLEEQGIKEVITKFTDLINSNDNGKTIKVEEIGKKKLAYEINKQSEGYYTVYTFEAKPEFISELERIYRITDSIMKFITIRKED